jgi:hypothetical protein
MTNIFEDGIVMQPVLPKLTVLKLDTVELLEKVAEFMRQHPKHFVGKVSVDYATVEGDKIVDANPVFSFTRDIAKLYSYLVTSENGTRFITHNATIQHGVIDGLPSELFTPIIANVERTAEQEADRLTETSHKY